MKKLKGILLFGILTLLGIGSSFGIFFELNDLTGSQLLIPNYSYRRDGTYYSTYNYSLGNASYYSGEILYLDNRSIRNLYVCRDSNLNILGFSTYGSLGNLTYGNTISFGDVSNCSSFNQLINFEYIYLSNSIPISPYSIRSSGGINSYIYFDDNYINTNYGNFRDVPTGYTRQKLFLSFVGNYGIFSTGSSGDYLFTSIGRDSFNVEDLGDGLYNFDLDVYSGILELHYSDYSLPYYSGSRTIILGLGSGVVYFNFYTGYYYGIKEIQDGVLPSLKGVLTYNNSSSDGYTQFINLLNNGDKIVLTIGGNNGISFTSYGYNYFTQTNLGGGYFTKTSNYSFNFQSDNSVPTFITPSGNGNQSNENPFGIFGTKSLFYYCNVQMDTYDSIFCYNPDGSRKSDDELKNCYVSKYANLESGTGFSEFYCIDDRGLIENIAIEIDGSGSNFIPCNDSSCQYSTDFGNLGMSGYSVDFFDNYLNTTGYFFKCPWPYDTKLTIWPKLITLLNGVDILLPINCGIAGFSYGKNVFSFENSGHFVPNGPLLNFEGDNWKFLYYFFDVLISIGIIIFVGKIFYLFHK